MLKDFRCRKCQKLLGKYLECRHLEIKCPRCGSTNSLTPVILTNAREKLPIVSTI